jgi:hypothetical protein
VSKEKCGICGKDKRFEQIYPLPGRLLALGYKHEDKAHLSCIEEKEEAFAGTTDDQKPTG